MIFCLGFYHKTPRCQKVKLNGHMIEKCHSSSQRDAVVPVLVQYAKAF